MTDKLYAWEPPTAESLHQAFQAEWDMIPSMQDLDNNFPFLYDRQVGEEGERYEVLPGLFGKVSNYYMTNPGAYWDGSQVWINNGEFLEWYNKHREYECYHCHDQGCYQCMDKWQLME